MTDTTLSDSIAPLPNGTVLCRGSLRVTGVLGQGGFGITYLCEHTALTGVRRAVKELAPLGLCIRAGGETVLQTVTRNAADLEAIRRRFVDEATTLGRLASEAHENGVVQVHDVWSEDGSYFFAMEYVEAADRFPEIGADPASRRGWEYVRPLGLQLLQSLAWLQRHGVVHGDIKPSNVIVTRRRGALVPVLIDLGSSRVAAQLVRTMTSIQFTQGYAAPEWIGGRIAEGLADRVDLYGWGLMMFGALVGHPPGLGTRDQPPDVATRVSMSADPYERAAAEEALAAAGAPPGWARVIAQCVQLRADARPAGAAAALAVIEALDEQALSAPRARGTQHTMPGRPAADRAPRPVAALLGVTAVLGTGLVAVVLGTSRGKVGPSCGDGTCESVETCELCPEDCGQCPLEVGASCSSDAACASGSCSNGLCSPDGFAYIPAGTFTMGSPDGSVPGVPVEEGRDTDETQHSVTLTGDFWMSTTEVTQDEWRSLMGTSPSSFTSCGGACPVEHVSWLDAVGYANARSASEGLASCYDRSGGVIDGATVYDCEGYRLPTEAEWEYAARGGTTGARYGTLSQIAWTADNSGSRTHPVGELTANAYGLYDMLGNVWEWTNDGYGDYPRGSTTDPTGVSRASARVYRGRSWNSFARLARAADRNGSVPGNRDYDLGFRLVRSVP